MMYIDLCFSQYLAKTHNCWHRVGMLLEQRAQENGELEYHIKEPPAYDGIYSDQLLEVPKHVCVKNLICICVYIHMQTHTHMHAHAHKHHTHACVYVLYQQ